MAQAQTISYRQEIEVHYQAVDEFGNPAAIDPTTGITWTSTGGGTLVDDGIGPDVRTYVPPESTVESGVVIEATGDADLGEGVVPITATLTLDVMAPQATAASFAVNVRPRRTT